MRRRIGSGPGGAGLASTGRRDRALSPRGRPLRRTSISFWRRSLPLALSFLAINAWAGSVAAAQTSSDTLRLLVYNTHHGEGMDGILELERIAALVRSMDPDVVTLQEIDRVVHRTGDVDQAQRYGELAGMEGFFGDFMPYQGGLYGMALLSRLPVLEWENVRLPDGAEPRTTLAARIRIPSSGREVWVAGIHFYRTEEERLAQARATAEFFVEAEPPVILAGDFNSQPGTRVMAFLGESWDIPEKEGLPFTFPADSPAREIDFILLRPAAAFQVLEYRVLEESVASDHRPLFMRVEIF